MERSLCLQYSLSSGCGCVGGGGETQGQRDRYTEKQGGDAATCARDSVSYRQPVCLGVCMCAHGACAMWVCVCLDTRPPNLRSLFDLSQQCALPASLQPAMATQAGKVRCCFLGSYNRSETSEKDPEPYLGVQPGL